MKTLILVRHGKAVIRGLGLADFNRSLTEKGQSESKKIARAIRDRGVIADLLVSSPALRARETAEIFSEVFGYPPKQILLRPEIYESSGIPQFLSLIRNMHDRFNTICLFGHEPTLSELTARLVKFSRDTFPKSGAVAIQFNTENWSTVKSGMGKLFFIEFPRGQSSTFKELRQEVESEITFKIQQVLSDINDQVSRELAPLLSSASRDIARKFIKKMKKMGMSQAHLKEIPSAGKIDHAHQPNVTGVKTGSRKTFPTSSGRKK